MRGGGEGDVWRCVERGMKAREDTVDILGVLSDGWQPDGPLDTSEGQCPWACPKRVCVDRLPPK